MKKSIHMILAIVALIALTGCAGKAQRDPSFKDFAYGKKKQVNLTAEQHEQIADGLIRRKNYEMAFVHYNTALAISPDNLDIRVKKGNLLVLKGLDEQALSEFMKVLEKDPDHAIANASAGAVYFRAGLYKEARVHLEKAIRLNPLLWKAHNYLGILDDRDGNYGSAVKNFTAALDLNHTGNSTEIYNNLGVVHIAQDQYEQAVNAFRSALKNGDVSSRTYNNLGLALARMGRLDEALESFKYAGGESRANNNLGYVLLADNHPDKALPYFERAIELSPNFYVKAAENLKRARMATRFRLVAKTTSQSGSTPNPLLPESFPDSEQNTGGLAASPAVASPPPSSIQTVSRIPEDGDTIDKKSYGLHVSSWRDHEWAFNHCAELKKQGFIPWINQVDLGPKGVWYRVLVGDYDSIESAQAARPDVLTALKLDRATVYERIIPSQKDTHL